MANSGRSEVSQVVEAEKGDTLSPRNLHLRLRVVEFVVLISLLLNIAHWFAASHRENKLQDQVDAVQQHPR